MEVLWATFEGEFGQVKKALLVRRFTEQRKALELADRALKDAIKRLNHMKFHSKTRKMLSEDLMKIVVRLAKIKFQVDQRNGKIPP